MTARKGKTSTWKTDATSALKAFARKENKIRLATRQALDGLEVAAMAIEITATKTEEMVKDLRKANQVLVAAISAAQVERAEVFETPADEA